jgi:hypothetical protein
VWRTDANGHTDDGTNCNAAGDRHANRRSDTECQRHPHVYLNRNTHRDRYAYPDHNGHAHADH